jgi:hypothetical protein
MRDGCTECDRLWREYADCTHAHFRLVSKQQLAVMQNDTASASMLNRREHDAEQERSEARTALKTHEAVHSAEAS